MSFIRHRRATSPNKFECRNYDSKKNFFDTSAVEAVIKLVIHCARQKAVKLLDELEQEFRLIERRRQGLGKPNLLYVKDLYAGLSQSNYWKYENHTSGGLKNELPGVLKSNGSNTEKINKTDNGCADLELTHKRLCGVTGLTVDPDQNKLVLDFCRKLEDETLADWYDQMFYFVRSEMEHYTMMQKMSRDIEEDEDWGPTVFDESEEEELIDDV